MGIARGGDGLGSTDCLMERRFSVGTVKTVSELDQGDSHNCKQHVSEEPVFVRQRCAEGRCSALFPCEVSRHPTARLPELLVSPS